MKPQPPISWAMSARRPPSKPKVAPLVGEKYGQKLREAAKRAGIGWEALATEAGISGVSAWRVEHGKGSLKAALALRKALEQHGEFVEAPAISLGGPMDEWVELGERLYAYDRDAFGQLLQQIRSVVAAHETLKQGISLIGHPLPRRTK
jgi:transcriptional regulator with XRE-family HTH domain